MLKFRLAYYAYPIDNAAASMSWLYDFIGDTQKEILGRYAALQFDPGDAFKGTGEASIGAEVYNINREALHQADLVLAFLPAGVPTVGVILELEQAAFMGKTVVIFTDMRSWSLEGRFGEIDNVLIVAPDSGSWQTVFGWLDSREATGDAGVGGVASVPLPVLPVRERGHDASRLLPSRGYADDAGLDLVVAATMPVRPGSFVDVPCGIAVELPEGTWGLLTGRSSTLRKKHLLVHTGIIDAGYRGPLFAGVWNLNEAEVTVEEGERIAQLIVLPNLTMELAPMLVSELSPHPRGERGFGSTGE